jgi:hypothetical protein
MDTAVEHRLQFAAGTGADRLDLAAALAEHDGALAGPADIDDLVDADAAVGAVLPRLRLDRRGIGQFVVQLQEHLLAGDLGGDQPLGRVGKLVLRKQERAIRRGLGEVPLQILDPVAGQCRDHEHRVERSGARQFVGEREQAVAPHQVDLVEREDRRPLPPRQPLDDVAGIGVDAVRGIDEQHGAVGVGGAGPGGGDHRPVEPASRREDAGRIDKHELRLPRHRDAEQAEPRRLHLGGDDRQFAADEAVEQRRFAGVGRADQRDDGAARRHAGPARVSRASSSAAAPASAARFDEAVASASSWPASRAATVKRRAWSGPSVATRS